LAKHLHDKRAVANKRLSDREVIELLQLGSNGHLLVGMIQATSGVPFAKKIRSECAQIPVANLPIYGAAALVTAEREEIGRDHLMQLDTRSPQQAWATISGLENGGMLIAASEKDTVIVRHRVIAAEVIRYLREVGSLPAIFGATLRSFAAAAAHLRDNSDPTRRTFIRLLNHSYIDRLGLTISEAREIYDSVEEILQNDFHYWLQRGSLEVERGDVNFAMHHLKSALTTLGGERDYKVVTELAFLRLHIANNDKSPEATAQGLDALEDLLSVIKTRGVAAPHTMVILAQTGVPWLRDADTGRARKKQIVEEAFHLLKVGERLIDSNGHIAATIPKAMKILEAMQRDLAA
jgi:hypothetical protein